MTRAKIVALLGLLMLLPWRAWAAQNVVMCAPVGTTVNQVQTFANGILKPDANGCVTIDISTAKDPAGRDMMALLRAGYQQQAEPNHLVLPLGSNAAAPTAGTGTVVAGSSDNAFEVTGGTSPVTVTFQTAFANKPVCVCDDETAALGACKVTSTTTTAVVTTTGTDSFFGICLGK